MRLFTLLLALLLLASCERSDKMFSLLSERQTGVTFNNYIEEDADNNVLGYGYFYNGGGVAAADFNNDGLTDLYFTGNMVANQMYLNRGEMSFEDVSEASKSNLNQGWKTGVSVVDINNDGWMDLYICRAGAQDPNLRRNMLLVNQGKTDDGVPVFTEMAAQYGLDDPAYSTQAVFFDYDKDGDTDCFLLNHSVQQYAGFSQLLASYRDQKTKAYGNKLLRNDAGHFVDVTDSSGIVSNVLSFGLGINVADLNDDGWDDIYISNDYNENDYLYLNQKNGHFKEVIKEATGHVSLFSMGTDAADINNDGLTDVLTLDMLPATNERIKITSGDDHYDKYQTLVKAGFHDQSMRNMLQLNNGPNAQGVPVFSEIGQLAGISNTDWSWSGLMADFDNDGWKDIFISNGYARDYTNMEFLKFSMEKQIESRGGGKALSSMDIIAQMPAIDEANFIFKNQQNLNFTNEVKNWGLDQKSQSNGAVYADLDNDGDLDLVVNNIGQKAFVYRNNAQKLLKQTYLQIDLKGAYYQAVGARVWLYANKALQTQHQMPVRGYQSAMFGPLHFGLGGLQSVDSVRVVWADGKVQTVKDVKSNQTIHLDYAEAVQKPVFSVSRIQPFFTEVDLLEHSHELNIVNDFKVQTLLPEMLSNRGPFSAQADLNQDGVDDLYFGGAKGQPGILYLSQPGNRWKRSVQPAFAADQSFEDSQAVFLDSDQDGDWDLLVGSAGYGLAKEDLHLFPRLYINEKGQFRKADFPQIGANAGALSVADYDRDGAPDIVIGNRVKPGQFPDGDGAVLLKNTGNGHYQDITAQNALGLSEIGMVTAAHWQDLNKDGWPELLLTSNWGSIHIFANEKGKLSNVSEKWGVTGYIGNWKTMKIADLDGDGDYDLVVGNSGLNNFWHTSSSNGQIGLYAADFDGLNRTVPVLSIFEDGKEYPYASRDELLDQVPSLKKKYPNYTAYSTATMQNIFSTEQLKVSKRTVLNTLQSGVFENRDGQFVFHALPVQAQFAPVDAITIMDVNHDWKPDLVLGGNDSFARVRIGRSDASLGQVFINQGGLDFSYLPQQISGLFNTEQVVELNTLKIKNKTYLLVGNNGGKVRTYLQKNGN